MEFIPTYHSAKNAAEIIGVSYRLILKWINSGELKCSRIGENNMIRISDEQIHEFMTSHEIVKGSQDDEKND